MDTKWTHGPRGAVVTRPGVGVSRVKVYRFVRDRRIALDPPTVREVQEHLGRGAIESVRRHLVNLVAEGRLQHHPGKARGCRWPGANVSRAEVLERLVEAWAGEDAA